jgi:hypothetical protein
MVIFASLQRTVIAFVTSFRFKITSRYFYGFSSPHNAKKSRAGNCDPGVQNEIPTQATTQLRYRRP